MTQERAHWGSRLGFILAAAGSAVGLGNIWKFPYITGENGGGLFVLIYLGCIALIGIPVMVAEIAIGRATQQSPVGAIRQLTKPASPWMAIGWMGVLSAFVILSYYSVVAGWAMHYVWLSLSGAFSGNNVEGIANIFDALYVDSGLNLMWHAVFMLLTIGIVLGGVRGGVERASRLMMPALFIMLIALMFFGMTTEGFGKALEFVFAPNTDKLSAAAILEALGHSFFTLSIGMGAMLTYGSYVDKKENIVISSITISILDTVVALLACLVLFPITFSFGMEPAAGPGLVFKNIPMAFAQLPGGGFWATIFFILLTFAALSSAISLLEVAASYFIDERGYTRRKAVLLCGAGVFLVGIPSALSGGTLLFGQAFADTFFGKNWFDTFDFLASNILLPAGGLGIAIFMAWRVGGKARHEAVTTGSKLAMMQRFYYGWLILLRYLVPIGVGAVFLHAIGLI